MKQCVTIQTVQLLLWQMSKINFCLIVYILTFHSFPSVFCCDYIPPRSISTLYPISTKTKYHFTNCRRKLHTHEDALHGL